MLLLISLCFCHFLADWTPLSTSWMLRAKSIGKPIFPIFIHGLVHACLMTIALFIFGYNSICLINCFLIQLLSHTVIDTLKGKINVWSPIVKEQSKSWYWMVLGFDQFLHTLFIILIYFLTIK